MRVAIISFSDNVDHQEIIYSLYREIENKSNIYTIGIRDPKFIAEFDNHNLFVNAPKRPGISKGTFNIREYLKLLRIIRQLHIDTIYFESLHVWNLPLLILLRKVKKFHVIHDIIPHEGDRQEKVLKVFNRLIGIFSNYVVVHNRKYIDYLSKEYKVKFSNIKFIDIYKDFGKYTPLQQTKRVLFLGRINLYKGVEYLEEIIKECPGLSFDIVGRATEETDVYINNIKKYNNVNLTLGYVTNEEYYKHLREAELIILPYRTATQSGVVIDAYKASRYVVAFDVGAIGEQIKNHISGELIESGNIKKFSQALNDFFELTFEERKKRSLAAWDYGMNKFSIQNNVQEWIKLINE
ncbi:glycosyltransferase family 4 protein [[Clostridium] hylemonae]|uniref:Glycosyltransferase, group 1 family protein n=1 Tax=[Clostridium] hylemonae DSM 15053 TaxID=553973 RepID=C0C0F0_9FIRM|nr:glycosyltransferase family 4 protein [[Clostridium] hylemonae]EEG74287.1 glycosyltransferase, group 1 family protein [[Clostridium] hylemonae DSM 15053]BDF05890.1 hypothetical protein CE91St63_29520 [[Clostridium] hylemonae]